jgi:hypothetical protein
MIIADLEQRSALATKALRKYLKEASPHWRLSALKGWPALPCGGRSAPTDGRVRRAAAGRQKGRPLSQADGLDWLDIQRSPQVAVQDVHQLTPVAAMGIIFGLR